MALVVIEAVNQTASPQSLTQLMVPNGVIPASTTVILTAYNWVEEILRDTELQGYIENDAVTLTVNSIPLTKAQSLAFLDAPTTPVKMSLGESSQAPTTTDDAAHGYSIGSVWITTGGAVYTCTNATTNAAVWASATATPLSDLNPQALGTPAPGTGSAASREDHVHAHGDLAGGTLHADATYTTDGFMPTNDKHWANHAFDTGVADGGFLTYGTGLNINVAAGTGFIIDAEDETTGTLLVTWDAGSVAATANTTSWIYITSAGTVSISSTEPALGTTIILGVVRANATQATFLSRARPTRLKQNRANLGEFFEDTWGGIATSGFTTTINGTNALRVDVTSGVLYISGEKQTAAATAPITFTYWYRNGTGGWVTVPGQTTFNTTNFDSGTGTLAAIPANRWKKDVIFACINGSGTEYHVLYAQKTYVTEPEARGSTLPTPPPELLKYAGRFAGVIVQQGATAIASVANERPGMGQNDSESRSGIAVRTTWIPIQSSSSLSQSTFGRQIVVSVASNGSGNLTFFIPPEAVSVVYAYVIGIPSSGASGAGKNLDFWTDYGTINESPTTHQESDTTSVYDYTGRTGLFTIVKDLKPILTNASGGDLVGMEVKHNSIGGAIEYCGISLAYEVQTT